MKSYPQDMKNLFNKLAEEAKQTKLKNKKVVSAQNILDSVRL